MGRLVLIDFYSEWCEPCRRQTEIVREVAARMGDAVEIRTIDIGERRDLIRAYRLVTVPTIVIESDGLEVKRFETVVDAGTLETILTSLRDDHA
ncbi:thioredoxin family protein [Methanofollis fontis]|uniref:Thiol reductase thioredoxin n=1 Tax=Methanofollis fontis TaxID=2052832 RepID=A0A483CPG4_9EURY|nr:thioredoxin domain-containing protein [Methanofollis fontis]TAJ43998.1 thiol reductase thioredoxin [Methanofollis fontis]